MKKIDLLKKFNQIRKEKGLKEALAWRNSKFDS